MIEHINEVIVPYVDQKRDDLDLSGNYLAVAIFDHFKGQLTERGNYTSIGREQRTLSAYSSCVYCGTSTHGYIRQQSGKVFYPQQVFRMVCSVMEMEQHHEEIIL